MWAICVFDLSDTNLSDEDQVVALPNVGAIASSVEEMSAPAAILA